MPGIIEILAEREGPTGWTFDVQEIRADGSLAKTALTMSWQDYDFFCPDGAVPPEQVARAVAEVARELWADGIPARLDASQPRRKAADADRRIIERVDMRAI